MTNKQLIKIAASITKQKNLGDNSAGSVGCALLSEKGQVYTGVCIDTSSSMGYCAEHNAIGSMVTQQEYRIKKIVAVWKNEAKGKKLCFTPLWQMPRIYAPDRHREYGNGSNTWKR